MYFTNYVPGSTFRLLSQENFIISELIFIMSDNHGECHILAQSIYVHSLFMTFSSLMEPSEPWSRLFLGDEITNALYTIF